MNREQKLGLNKISYDTFEAGVKRYGYTGTLTDSTLVETSPSGVDAKDLQDRNSITHFYYQADHAFKNGNYEAQVLLLLGFLLAVHKTP